MVPQSYNSEVEKTYTRSVLERLEWASAEARQISGELRDDVNQRFESQVQVEDILLRAENLPHNGRKMFSHYVPLSIQVSQRKRIPHLI